jgi:NTP pyrophosphatase (non-canonical NTP hydrolase)
MALQKMQEEVDEWTGQYTPQYWPPYEQFARLSEEVGEVAREINHLYGVKKKREEGEKNLPGELADILFTVVCIANAHKIDLQAAWDEMMAKKCYGRDKDRYQRKETKTEEK